MGSVDTEIIGKFTFDDFKHLAGCIPEDNNVEHWENNVQNFYVEIIDRGTFSSTIRSNLYPALTAPLAFIWLSFMPSL